VNLIFISAQHKFTRTSLTRISVGTAGNATCWTSASTRQQHLLTGIHEICRKFSFECDFPVNEQKTILVSKFLYIQLGERIDNYKIL